MEHSKPELSNNESGVWFTKLDLIARDDLTIIRAESDSAVTFINLSVNVMS
jgi:hypothetical protein